MSQNHTVTITIRGSDLSDPALNSLIGNLRQAGAAADATTVDLQQVGTAARTAGGGFGSSALSVLGFGSAAGVAQAGTQALLGGIGGLARGAVGLAGGLLQTHAAIEDTRATLTAFTGSTAEADRLLEQIQERAKKTPYSFQAMAQAVTSLVPAAKQSGVALDDLLSTAEMLAAVNPAEGLAGAAFALREALSGDFTSIIERFNLSRVAINDLKEQGVPALDAVNRVLADMGVNMDVVALRSQTFNGLWSTLKDTVQQAAVEISKPFFDHAKDGLQRLIDYTESAAFDEKVDAWAVKAEAFADAVIQNAPAVAGSLLEIAEALGNITTGLLGVKETWDELPGPVKTTAKVLLESLVLPYKNGVAALDEFNRVMGQSTPLTREQAIAAGFSAQAYDEWAAAQRAATQEAVTGQAAAAEYREELLEQRAAADGAATAIDGLAVATGNYISELERMPDWWFGRDQPFDLGGSSAANGMRDLTAAMSDANQAFATQAELVQEQGRDAHTAAAGMDDLTRAQSEAAFATDRLQSAQQSLANAYQIGLDIQQQFGAQAGEYQGQLSSLEKAYENIRREKESGNEITAEEQRLLDDYPTLYGRLEGGITDATTAQGLWAANNARLMLVQDELNKQFPNLIAGTDEWRAAMIETGNALGFSDEQMAAMLDGAGGLQGAIAGPGGLTEAVNNLITTLGGVPADTNAKVNVEVERTGFDALIHDLVSFEESSYYSTAGVYTFGAPPTVIRDNDNTGGGGNASGQSATESVGRAISSIGPAGLAEARDAAASAQQYTDLIDQIVGYMADAAERMGDGMEAAQQYVDLADSAVGAMLSGAELLRSLSGDPVAYTEDAAESIAAIKFALEHAVTSLADTAALMSAEGMESAGQFADAAGSTATAMLSGLELLTALSEQGATYGAIQERQIADLKFALEKAVISLADAAALMDMEGVEGAERLADAAGSIFGALSDTLDFLRDLTDTAGEATISSRELIARVNALSDQARIIADQFASAAAGWNEEINPDVESLGDAISDSSGGLVDTLTVLQAITGQADGARLSQRELFVRAHQLAEDARIIAEQFASAAAEWDGGDVSEFADSVGAAADALSSVASAYEAIAGVSELSLASTEIFYANFLLVLDLIGRMDAAATPYEAIAEHLAGIMENVASSLSDAASAASDAAVSGAATMDSAADALDALSGLGNLSGGPSLGSGSRGGGGPKGGPLGAGGYEPTVPTTGDQQLDDLISTLLGFDATAQQLADAIRIAEEGDPTTDTDNTASYAADQLALLKEIQSNPDAWPDGAAEAVGDQLAASLGDLGILGMSQLDFVNALLGAVGVSPLASLPAEVAQAVADGNKVAADAMAEAVERAMGRAGDRIADQIEAAIERAMRSALTG